MADRDGNVDFNAAHDRGRPATFGARSTALEVISGIDLGGRDAIVTGGAGSLGAETVRALASAGARVIIAARNPEKAGPTVSKLRKETGSQGIELRVLDLASLASIRSFVQEFLALRRSLHILINNAGILKNALSYTEDGFESHFGINHLGHFALTKGLLPAMKAAGKARVISMTSIAHRYSDIVFEDLNFHGRSFDPRPAYGQSKTATALFALALTQRYASEGITSNAVHPGIINTEIFKDFTREEMIGYGWIADKDVAQGAATIVWAATAPELEDRGGLYLEDCAIAGPWSGNRSSRAGYVPYVLDPDRARRLWTVSGELTGD